MLSSHKSVMQIMRPFVSYTAWIASFSKLFSLDYKAIMSHFFVLRAPCRYFDFHRILYP